MKTDAETGLKKGSEGLHTIVPATIAFYSTMDGNRQGDRKSCGRGEAWAIRGPGLACISVICIMLSHCTLWPGRPFLHWHRSCNSVGGLATIGTGTLKCCRGLDLSPAWHRKRA